MRKRRRTVYVSPGKDVTLYVPADTPSVVIDYLNRLKDEGQFSQGVMDILIHHVTGQDNTEFHQPEHAAMFQENSLTQPKTPATNLSFTLSQRESDELPTASALQSLHEAPSSKPPFQLKMADIFRQAQKNTGKLADAGPDSNTD